MKRAVLLIAGVLWCVLVAGAAGREWHDLPYVSGGAARQKLDLYLPEGKPGPLPVLLYVHGGAWKEGSKNYCPARPMVAHGFAVASLDYRLSQEAIFPAQIEDCKAAVRWLRAHAGEYGLDPQRFGAWGESAGGHLVALLGTTGQGREFTVGENLEQSSAVQAVIDWFGPADFLHYGETPGALMSRPGNAVDLLLGGTILKKAALARQASPVYFVSKLSAPFLIMQGDQDPLVPMQQSVLLHKTLLAAGVESTLRILPGMGHGGGAFGSPESLQAMGIFVKKHLGGF